MNTEINVFLQAQQFGQNATQLILDKRKKEDENTVKKTGVLKHDLFYIDSRYPEIRHDISDIIKTHGWWLKQDTVLSIVEQIKNELLNNLQVKAGTLFDCYIDKGEELWYDSSGIGLEEMSAEWAKNNLKDISDIKNN